MSIRSRNRTVKKGFTLPEILVSITLVAILAAVVVPTITSQIRKGDPTRIGSEFMAIRGAVEQFLSDVRRYPKDIGQLTTVITNTQTPLGGTSLATYGTPEIARWRGPYLSKDGTAALQTGYSLNFNTAFDTVTLATSGTSSCTGANCGQKYMVLSVPMVNGDDPQSITELDKQFDDGTLTTGVVRYRTCANAEPVACSPTTAKDTIKLLLMPIY
jgi:prepilin-type N-terminal cleavage/methylation domain-containing protein